MREGGRTMTKWYSVHVVIYTNLRIAVLQNICKCVCACACACILAHTLWLECASHGACLCLPPDSSLLSVIRPISSGLLHHYHGFITPPPPQPPEQPLVMAGFASHESAPDSAQLFLMALWPDPTAHHTTPLSCFSHPLLGLSWSFSRFARNPRLTPGEIMIGAESWWSQCFAMVTGWKDGKDGNGSVY